MNIHSSKPSGPMIYFSMSNCISTCCLPSFLLGKVAAGGINRIWNILSIVCFFSIFSAPSINAQEEIKYELNKIEFSGNNSFSSGSLLELLKSQESPSKFWQFLNKIISSLGKPPVYFDSLNIESDIRHLKDFYISNGFFAVQILPGINSDTANRTIVLHYSIKEGPGSTFGTMRVRGVETIDDELKSDLHKTLGYDTLKRYSQSVIRTGVDQLLQQMENRGFMNARYDSTIVIQDTAKSRANLDLYINSGSRFFINGLNIEKNGDGAGYVQDDLLRDIVGIKSGEVYNLEKLRLSQVRLFRTGLFSSVILRPGQPDSSGNRVPIMLNGSIGKMNELSPEILINNQQNTFNFGVGGSYTRKNFIGYARKLSVSANLGIQNIFNSDMRNILRTFELNDTSIYGYIESTLRIEQPYVFNRPIFGILEGYFKLNKDNLSNKRSYGAKLSFEFELPTYTFINFLMAYYNFEVVNEIYLQSGAEVSLNESLSILGAEWKAYKANDPVFPTHGYNLSFLFEEANTLTWLFEKLYKGYYNGTMFYKFSSTAAFYAPIFGSHIHILASKFKLGLLQPYYGLERNIPSTKKYTAGGSNSLRGWKPRELAPTELRTILGKTVAVAGGTFLYEGTLEYRYRLNKDAGSVIFWDYGNTWLNYKNIRLDEIAVNTGVGLRYYSPFAPFRVDFGIKVYDPSYRKSLFKKIFFKEAFEFQFGIGEAF